MQRKLITACLLLLLCLPVLAEEIVWYVSPNGNSNKLTKSSPGSLARARDKARALANNMKGNIIVYLLDGMYELKQAFELDARDSGKNGYYIIYKAAPGAKPVISGGSSISNWTLYDKEKNIYRATVDAANPIRQLYVNGKRAIRARSKDDLTGFHKTSSGYTLPQTGFYASMAAWKNISQVEIVSTIEWKSFRCPVATVKGDSLFMQSPAWANANESRFTIDSPEWIENAYELLDEEGEWYYDEQQHNVYYKPFVNENLQQATIRYARLETLVQGKGTVDKPLENIQFYGITFQDATWFTPSTHEGYIPMQAIFHRVKNNQTERIPAHLTFTHAKNIGFERCRFVHLGASALEFLQGSQENNVTGNRFEDISGCAIQLGGTQKQDHHPDDKRLVVKNNGIRNNYITNVANEYYSCVAVFVGYTESTQVAHNEIHQIPYTAISVGWGWSSVDPGGKEGYTTPTTSKNNLISHNLIYDFMKILKDGGGIYSLGAQPGMYINHNHIYESHNEFGLLYLDEGTNYATVENNVLEKARVNWIIVQPVVGPHYAKYNVIRHNYTGIPKHWVYPENNYMFNNTLVFNNQWPEEAKEIMKNAGIEQAYQDIKK